MFKINKTTKYTIFALAAFVMFTAMPITAKAGEDDGYYYGSGYEDSFAWDNTSYSSDQSTSYYPNYVDYTTPSYTYSEPSVSYVQPTTYYDNSYYPSYYSDYSYGYSSGCSSCSTGGYVYTPAPQIVYVPNTPVVQPIVTPVYNNLTASCTINPNNVYLNDSVTLSGNAAGGNGSYSYFWSGSDGISGSSQVITGRFTSIGSKTVSLTVTSGNQSVTRSCNAYVNQNTNYNYNNNYNYNSNYTNLTAICSALPTNANVGDNVIWTVYPNGGNGAYTYSWTGTDSLSYGNAYQIQQRYTTPGTKTANVTVYTNNGQSVTVSCNVNVTGSVVAGTPISGIYLNEVPATGIDFNMKVALYVIGLTLWSAFVGFMLVSKRKTKLALANRSKIEDFKQENLRKKGLL
ncbi:MAG: hypothetical protein WCQ00_01835 [bacterium]